MLYDDETSPDVFDRILHYLVYYPVGFCKSFGILGIPLLLIYSGIVVVAGIAFAIGIPLFIMNLVIAFFYVLTG